MRGSECAQDAGACLKQQHEQVALGVEADLVGDAVFLDEPWRQFGKTLFDRLIKVSVIITEFRMQAEDGNLQPAANFQFE